MELSGDDIIARDRGGEPHAVVARRDYHIRVVGDWVVRIDEIEVSIVGNAAEDRMRPGLVHTIPSDLRDFQHPAVNRCRKAHDPSREHPKASRIVLLAAVEKHLDTYTNAEERLSGTDVVAQRVVEPMRAKVAHR